MNMVDKLQQIYSICIWTRLPPHPILLVAWEIDLSDKKSIDRNLIIQRNSSRFSVVSIQNIYTLYTVCTRFVLSFDWSLCDSYDSYNLAMWRCIQCIRWKQIVSSISIIHIYNIHIIYICIANCFRHFQRIQYNFQLNSLISASNIRRVYSM